jgi:DNA-binding XRE family transcriptional regulator
MTSPQAVHRIAIAAVIDATDVDVSGCPLGAEQLIWLPGRCEDDDMADVVSFHQKHAPTPDHGPDRRQDHGPHHVRDHGRDHGPDRGRDRGPEPLWREVLGRSLRTIREEQGGRLVDIAERAGISPQYLSEIERGRKEPSSEMIAAVTGALGVDLADLLAGIAGAVRTDALRTGNTRAGTTPAGVIRASAIRAGVIRAGAIRGRHGAGLTVSRPPTGPVLMAA